MQDEIISNEIERTLGKTAQKNNILAARVLAETVKTTLGPKGMDKMLVDRAGNITVTNDGVTILEEMEIEHPAAKMLVEIAKTQEKEVGDGTTTVVMLAGRLLENAEKLLNQKIHPTIIIQGFRLAQKKSQEILKSISIEINSEVELAQIAQTAMTGKGAEYLKEQFSEIIVDAVKLTSEGNKLDLRNIRIEKQKGESLEQTELIKGIVIDKERVSIEMPQKVENAKIALVEESLEIRSPETNTRISVASPEQLQSFLSQEDTILKNKVEKIKQTGANVLICQRGIDDVVQFYLAKAGIYSIRRVPKTDMQAISKSTGAKLISKLSEITPQDLGNAQKVEEIKYHDDGYTYITGCSNPKSLTILIRGGSEHVLDEIKRAIEDALGDVASTLKDSRVLAGGGAAEIELSSQLKKYSKTLKGREQLAVEEFANSLEFIPATLAENAGMDPIDVLTELKSAHEAGQQNSGLNLFTSKVEDTLNQGIIEPLKVKTQAISSATDVAITLLRIDDVIAAKSNINKINPVEQIKDYD